MRSAGASRHIVRSVLLPLCETPTKKVGPAEAKHKHTHDLAKQLPIWRGHEHGHGHMGRFHQGSSSQSRKINCKWEANPFNGAAACILLHVLVVPVMLSLTRALVTTVLLVRAKRHQDQTRQTDYHRCSVSSSNTLDYVGTVPLTLSASGKSPTMPRALCAFALSLRSPQFSCF